MLNFIKQLLAIFEITNKRKWLIEKWLETGVAIT